LTHLGHAILRSSLAPEEGLLVYLDLDRVNKGVILSNELHLLYQLTPVSLSFKVDWKKFRQIFEKLNENEVESNIMRLIGIDLNMIIAYSHAN
jgi:DNA polymerase theta